jgi:outer membrane immunogenic protein
MRLTKKVSSGIAAVAVIGALVGAPVLAGTVAKKPPPPPARPKAIFSWAGFYLGANAGGVCSHLAADPTNAGNPVSVPFAARMAADGEFPGFLGPRCGFIGGGQIGYNWQSTNWVWGVEHDIQGTTLRATDTRSFPGGGVFAFAPSTEQASSKLRALGTFRARAGVLATPTLLIYGTGGLAYGAVKNTISTTGVPSAFPGVTVGAENSDIIWGWVVGAGAEWLVSGPWTAKAEYLYYSLPDTVRLNYGVLVPSASDSQIDYKFRNNGHIFRLGLNRQFGQ